MSLHLLLYIFFLFWLSQIGGNTASPHLFKRLHNVLTKVLRWPPSWRNQALGSAHCEKDVHGPLEWRDRWNWSQNIVESEVLLFCTFLRNNNKWDYDNNQLKNYFGIFQMSYSTLYLFLRLQNLWKSWLYSWHTSKFPSFPSPYFSFPSRCYHPMTPMRRLHYSLSKVT